MTTQRNQDITLTYEIKVAGHISPQRVGCFSGLQVQLLPGGETIICGSVPDQAALFGLLIRIRDLSLTLISVSSQPLPENEQPEKISKE